MPFGKQPEDYVHGVPQYYATAMPTRGGAIPLVVKSYEGRPTKVEGNPLHPDSNGGTDRFAQASILDLYDPDRATHFTQSGQRGRRRTAALDFLSGLSRKFAGEAAARACASCWSAARSPSRARLQKLIAEKLPKAKWFVYEPVDFDIHREAATLAFGKPVKPVLPAATRPKVIVSLDCDFIGAEEDAHNHIRRFRARAARSRSREDSMNRLYAVESLLTLTGVECGSSAAACRRARCCRSRRRWRRRSAAGRRQLAAAQRWPAGGRGCRSGFPNARRICWRTRRSRWWWRAAAAAGGASAGPRHERGAGQRRQDGGVPSRRRADCEGGIAELAQALNAGEVETLVDPGRQPGLQRAGGSGLGGDAAQGQDGRAAGLLRGRDVRG